MHLPIFSPDFTRFCDVFSDVFSTLASCSTLVILIKRTGGIRGFRKALATDVKAEEKSLGQKMVEGARLPDTAIAVIRKDLGLKDKR